MIFADLLYNLQLTNKLFGPHGTEVDAVNDGVWGHKKLMGLRIF
jgi:hypothetical protein